MRINLPYPNLLKLERYRPINVERGPNLLKDVDKEIYSKDMETDKEEVEDTEFFLMRKYDGVIRTF